MLHTLLSSTIPLNHKPLPPRLHLAQIPQVRVQVRHPYLRLIPRSGSPAYNREANSASFWASMTTAFKHRVSSLLFTDTGPTRCFCSTGSCCTLFCSLLR